MISIEDIIDNTGTISKDIILQKLQNWITEIHLLINSISKTWKSLIKSEPSINTKIKKTIIYNKLLKLTKQSKNNKDVYNYILKAPHDTPLGFKK